MKMITPSIMNALFMMISWSVVIKLLDDKVSKIKNSRKKEVNNHKNGGIMILFVLAL